MRQVSLSKSKILLGQQCPKQLYLTKKLPGPKTPLSAAKKAIFDQGHQVGEEARKRFPGGVLIQSSRKALLQAARMTQEHIAGGALVLYEATFRHRGVWVQVDILERERVGAEWHLIEVKSSSGVKEQHIQDVAVQVWVLRGAGVQIGRASVMHINTECVFPDLENLFKIVDVTERVEAVLPGMTKLVGSLQEMLVQPDPPEVDIGPHCQAPYPCAFQTHCWGAKQIPELSVFNVPALSSERKWELYACGIIKLESLASSGESLTQTQNRMCEATLSGQRVVDQPAIRAAMRAWEYPLYFLDFETINPAIPRFEGTRPFAQIPFQFSCHMLSEPGAVPSHYDYLHNSATDPREPLIRALLAVIGERGSVVAYNKGFESARLSELADAFPAYAEALRSIAERLVDPMPIVRAHVYDAGFRGSFSIKTVAPALLGEEFNYGGMVVGDGVAAQLAFEELIAPMTSSRRRAALRKAMLEYCRKDTLAMVGVVEYLRKPSEIMPLSSGSDFSLKD